MTRDLGLAACIVLLLTIGGVPTASAQLVNGSFEVPALGGGYQYGPTGAGVGWTFGGNSGVQGNGSAWGAAPAPDGTQTAFVQGTGAISQTINLDAGNYTLSFQAAQRPCCAPPYLQPIRISLDGAQIGSLVSPPSTSFSVFSIPISVAVTGAHTITIAGTVATDMSTFLDAVTLITSGSDIVWVEDALPAGATAAGDGGDGWTWVSSNPAPYSGALASQSNIQAGEHQHYFYNASATLSIASGDTLFAYVYLDPANPPSEVMVQWNDGSWEHRAYWGANLIPWGIDGTASRHYMGALPPTGVWVRLDVPAATVRLVGSTLNGMAFTLSDGRATWDHAGKSAAGGPQSQTIAFAPLSDQTLGNAPFALSATASSGLPVTFASLTTATCTVSGNTATLVVLGTCTIRASQAGDASYLAAPNVDRSFSVTSALLSQTITFGAPGDRTLGAAPFAVSATASSGLPVTFSSLTTPICTVSGNTVTLVAVGTCTIRAAQPGNVTYTGAPNVDQSFSVTQAAQTITFAALSSRALGSAAFAVSASASSGLAVTFSSLTTSVCTVSGSTVTLVAVGTCTVRASQTGNANYAAAPNVDQSFNVTAASQTITFGSLGSQTLGAAPFTVSATASSGLAVTFSSTTAPVCTVSGNTVTLVAVGTCTIRASQAGNANYAAAPNVDQSFSVTQASQTIIFGALSNKTLGTSPFTVNATASSGLPVTFSSTTAALCTVSGTTVTLVAIGACTIRASQAGSAIYATAPNVDQSFTVGSGQISQTITFAPLPNQAFGAAPFAVNATASSGLTVSFSSLTPPVCTLSGNAVTLVAAGICTIRASQSGNASYAPAPNVDQSFAVTSGQLFAPAVSYTTELFPAELTVADFNGDGKLDVAVLNLFSGSVSIFLGQGDGSLRQPPTTLLRGAVSFPSRMVAGDFNGDGKIDLAVSDNRNNIIGIYLGNGDGTFRAPTVVALGLTPAGIAVADLNGDGKLDLVVANGSDGTVVGRTVAVLIGNGDGTFQPIRSYPAGTNPRSVAIGDFNGDGKQDLVVANFDDSNLSILLGNGDGTFAPPSNIATGFQANLVEVADMNNDGKLDLAVMLNTSRIAIHLGRGDGTFAPVSNIALPITPNGLAIGDFNGDGILDLTIGNVFASNIGVLLGNGAGGFPAPIMFDTGSGPDALTAGSMRGNGVLDLVVANRSSNTLSVLLNASAATAPATLALQSGSLQSAIIGTAFATPLAATVRDASNRALPGIAVTFTAPASGASGTFAGGLPSASVLTDAFGVATAPTFTANTTGGAFSVMAATNALNATFALTNFAGNAAPTFASSPPPVGQWGTPYTYAVHANGIPAPTYAVTSGALPSGLSLATGTGTISGTPGAVGSFSGVITATNGINPPATQSFSIAIAQASQSIAFGPLSNRPGTASPFTVSATASSGLPVSLTSLTPAVCTVSGTTVTLVATITCTIRASQAGNANYAAAPNVDQSFSVTTGRASQTITFGALSDKLLSSPPFTISAHSSPGLLVTFASMTTTVCTVGSSTLNSSVSSSTVTLVAVGTCTIRASQAGNATWAPAPDVDQSFSVIPLSAQTITFAALSNRPFGTSFLVSATASSGLPVSFGSLTAPVCVMNGATVALVAIGTCTIRASQAGDLSYMPAANVDRSFSVTAASQIISFLWLTDVVLDRSPIELRATATSGLSVSFASLTPTVCHVNDNWVTSLVVGTCTVRASQAGNANYSPAPNFDQTFAVTPAFQALLFAPPATQSLLHPQLQLSATTSAGLPVTFSSLTPAVCIVSGSVATLVATGTCTIHATQAGDANNLPVSGDRSFLVTAGGVLYSPGPLPGPFIEYSTLLGGYNSEGYGRDTAFDVVVGPDGSACVGGVVAGTYFPGLSSATFTNGGLNSVYVAKLNPNRGQVDVATVAGGYNQAMAIDPAGNVYVAAYVNSTTYPITGGTYYPWTWRVGIFRVGADGNVQPLGAVVDPAVGSIVALAVDAAGAVYFTGIAAAGLVTTVNAAIPAASAPAGGPYLIKLAPGGGSVVYATYLTVPGSRPSVAPDPQQSPTDNQTTAYALAVDATGNAYLAGQANAGDFPVTPGAPDTADSQNRDAFVAKVNPTGSALLWVARIGGPDAERATSIALAPDGRIVIGGKTATLPFDGFPGTAGAFQTNFYYDMLLVDREHGFVAKLAADGSRWVFVAPIGSSGGNLVRGAHDSAPSPTRVAVDATGAIYVAGHTQTDRELPVAAQDELRNFHAIQSPAYYDDGSRALLYGPDVVFYGSGGFLMKLTPDGGRLIYSVIVNLYGRATGLALDAYGAAYVAGYEAGPPQVNAAQAAPGSVFVAKVLSQPTPLLLTATPNPGVAGQSVTLTATVADARYAGSIEFRDGAQLLATIPVVSGTATFATTFAVGIRRLSAVFHSSGPFDGAAAPELVQIVNQ